MSLVPALTCIPLSDEDRTGHMPKLFYNLICRTRIVGKSHWPVSTAATEHGKQRRKQGYAADMLVEEFRLLEVVTFQRLHIHLDELDQEHLLLDVTVIADEA